jgi:uncharacterized protein YjiS (DUF1127 family)
MRNSGFTNEAAETSSDGMSNPAFQVRPYPMRLPQRGGAKERRREMLYTLPATRTDIRRRHRLRAILFGLADRIAEWWRLRCDVRRLTAIDDRLLEDIGVGREEIAARVKGRR